jgi:hypothetical protein
MPLQEDLRIHLEQFHTAPFLFVGSGLSRRYLGLEDWEGLLRRFAAMTSRPYEFFRASANGEYPAIATEIARELHGVWWESPSFADSREKYKSDAKTRESGLKIEIARYLEDVSVARVPNDELTRELDSLANATIDGVITTNWDFLLEDIFPGLEVYVGQDELLFSTSHGIGEIYKIHGSGSKPNSLVVTAHDYEHFDRRNPYLAAKLLTVFAEHPVIFLGYSLNDDNVSRILQSIAQCLTSENIHQLRDRLILVRWDPDEAGYRWEDNTIVTHGFPIPVKTAVTSSFIPVFDCLSNLPRKFPARILRRLKEHVYQLVLDNDPADQLHVLDIDDDSDMSQIKVVYGVGLRVDTVAKQIRLSSAPDAQPVRLTDDPNAPMLPFALPSPDARYSSLQDELDALVRTWRSDNFAYIAHSRLRAFYSSRNQLELKSEALKCLLISAMYHQAPIHYWAREIGRHALIPLLYEEVNLDLFTRVHGAARLAFAVGMSDGEKVLIEIRKRSKHVAVRKLAQRLLNRLSESPTIHSEYRSPSRSTHQIGEDEITIDIATVFQNAVDVERVLSDLAIQPDSKSRARLKQLDAYFYGTQIK